MTRRLPLALLGAGLWAACGAPKDPTPTEAACNTCHGGAANAAPPVSTTGATATTDVAVGAHQVHLVGGTLGVKVACTECHLVPTSAQHSNGTAEVTFGTLASTGGLTPAWNRAAGTCANTYCHGAVSPSWTKVDGTGAACGTCHGDPPTTNGHLQVATRYCVGCHGGTLATDGTLKSPATKHLDGVVQATTFTHPTSWLADHQEVATTSKGVECKVCHGDDLRGKTGSGGTCFTCHPTGPPVGTP